MPMNEELVTRDLSWFAQRVQRGAREVFSEIVTITPEIAARLLETNADNRRINQAQVNQIAKDILSKKWVMNGETIIVDKEGHLIDGQHRLWGVVEAQESIQSLMVFGLTRDSRFTVDMGRQRKVGDYIHMTRAPNSTRAAAIARLWLDFENNRYAKRAPATETATKQDVLAFWHDHEKQIQYALEAIGSVGFIVRTGSATPCCTAYGVLAARHDVESVEYFFHGVTTGTRLEASDPRYWLRDRIELLRRDGERNWVYLEAILRYWNAWREGKKLSRALSLLKEYPEVK